MGKKLYDNLDKEKVIAYIHKDLLNARKINPKWYSDREVAMHIVSVWGSHLEVLPKEFKADKEIVRLAISESPSAIRCASKELRNDPDMRTYAFMKAGSCFIVDPLALMVFSTYDSILLKETGKNEEKTKAHPIYQKFKPIYDCNASFAEIEEFEKFLLKNKGIFLSKITRNGKKYSDLTEEELDEIDFTRF